MHRPQLLPHLLEELRAPLRIPHFRRIVIHSNLLRHDNFPTISLTHPPWLYRILQILPLMGSTEFIQSNSSAPAAAGARCG